MFKFNFNKFLLLIKVFYIGFFYTMLTSGGIPLFVFILYLVIIGLLYILVDRKNDSKSETYFSFAKVAQEVVVVYTFSPFLSGAVINPELMLIGIFIIYILDVSVRYLKKYMIYREKKAKEFRNLYNPSLNRRIYF